MTDEKTYPNMEAQRATGDWNPMWDLMRSEERRVGKECA